MGTKREENEKLRALKKQFEIDKERERQSKDLHARLVALDKEIESYQRGIEGKPGTSLTQQAADPNAIKQWESKIEELKAERTRTESRINEIMTSTPGPTEGVPAEGVAKPTAAEIPESAPTAAEAGLTGAAGTQPGGDYDINIGIDEEGGIVAPQGMTPEQLAIMVPGAFGASTPGQVKEAAERPSMPTAPPGSRPKDDFQATDYSPAGRRRFEKQIIADHVGFDPHSFNPMEYVNDAMRHLPQLFNHVFDGKIMWADRNKLNKKELAHWQSIVKMYRANKEKEGQEMQEVGLRIYNHFMNTFDKEAATVAKNLEAMRKGPKTMSFWSDEKGAMVLHERKGNKWVPTEHITAQPSQKQTKAEKASDEEYKDAWAVVKFFAKMDTPEPTDSTDASAKLQEIMSIMGDVGMTEDQERLYRKNLAIVMQRWGLEPGQAAPGDKRKKTYSAEQIKQIREQD
ncbi:MAG: hypothetical protein ACW99J_15905 [Candidatus Thorarchaeota archaeon]|jgi:hypothetical protein